MLRAVGAMSRNLHPLRDEPAASEIPVPGAQALGEHVTGRFAVLTSPTGWPVALAEHFRSEALVRRGTGPADRPLPQPRSGLRVEGESISVTSLHRLGSGVEIRIVGMSDEPTTARIAGDFTEVATLSLLGEQIDSGPADGTIEITLNPWEIRTLMVR
jgi:alpha-mannosidase